MVLKVNSKLMNPFFSIIIPTYNRAHMISKAIDSVIAQTFENLELIIVDDGSTDNTKELVASYQVKDSRIQYIYQENAERSAARNNGIRNAHGKYICFLDSDDSYYIDNLENWFVFIVKNKQPISFMFCEMSIVLGENISQTSTNYTVQNKFDFVFTNPIVPARVCVHNSLLKNHCFEEYMSVGEDVALWLKIINETELTQSKHIGLNYHIHEDNSVNPKNPSALKMYQGFKTFFLKYPYIQKKITKQIFNSYVSKIQTNIAKYYYRNGQKIKAISVLIKAVMKCPIHEHTKYRLRLIVLTFFSNNPNLYE
jgi:glycosyltransferase involved in cell wall biosynthesis